MDRVEVSFREVARFIQRAFPGAKSRRSVKVSVRSSYHVADYWDGGSRNYCMFVNLATGAVVHPSASGKLTERKVGNPFGLPNGDLELTQGYAVIEHTWFMGKDLGYRIYLGSKDDLRVVMGLPPKVETPVLPEASEPMLALSSTTE